MRYLIIFSPVILISKWPTGNNGVSYSKLYSFHVENRSVETVFTHANVYDDTLETTQITHCQRVIMPLPQWTAGLTL